MARAMRPPPGRSLWDNPPAQPSESDKVDTNPVAQSVEVVGRALKELNSTARADHQRIDLKDLLLNSSREAQYGELPAGVSQDPLVTGSHHTSCTTSSQDINTLSLAVAGRVESGSCNHETDAGHGD